ncbi:hypothetical protein [Nocardioides sp. SR21]|uniref:hypothetical protein n=1 Tax=Nocardioides sp. SR21 TaxID=2919501 RepID=UPI001FAA9234|nr:hypothetical protein [Nocardioides sp. SR21]
MAKRKAYLHIGPPRTGGGFLDSALTEHADEIEAATGVRHPAISAEEMFRAAIEMTRDHRAWGYQRREVEGAWAEICRRARKGAADVVFSQELLATCTAAQVDLLLDGLAGFEVHVVVTARERGDVLDAWKHAIGPERWHAVVVPDVDAEQAVWTAFGELVGFDATELPLDAGWRATRPMTGRPQAELLEVISAGAVADVVAEVTRLRAHNQALAERNAKLERKRKKLKKKLAAVG